MSARFSRWLVIMVLVGAALWAWLELRGQDGGTRGTPRRETRALQIRFNPDVRGSIAKEAVNRVIRGHIGEVRSCFEQDLGPDPDLRGRVQVEVIIAPSGAVQATTVEQSTPGMASAAGCIADAVRGWTFPAPEGGDIATITMPFVLEPAGD